MEPEIITDIEQGSQEWHDLRCGKMTASNFFKIVKCNRAKKWPGDVAKAHARTIVAERMTGKQKEVYSKQMAHGKKHEDRARELYEQRNWQTVRQVTFVVHGDYADVGCSPDGLIGQDGCIEIKVVYDEDKQLDRMLDQQADKDHVWQIQGGLWVTGRKWCDYVSYCPSYEPPYDLVVFRIHRDSDVIDELEDKTAQFRGLVTDIEKQVQDFGSK